MKSNLVIFCLITICFAFSCQQMPEDDNWLAEGEGKSLKVKVRSAGDAEIVYPVFLYAFSEDGKLVSMQTIEDVDENVSLTLSKGEFQVVAISGTSSSYQIPASPNLDDVITLLGTQGAYTPLMVGRTNVEIGQSANATAQITLKYVVASLNIKLEDVPSDVTGVQLALSPLHSTLSMAGIYGGESQKVKMDCSLTSEGIWSAKTTYIFPGNGTETFFSIYLKKDDGTEAIYGYTYRGVPEANHLFNVTGTYSGGVIIGGNFDVTDWEGTVGVEFDFGTTSKDNTNNNPSDGGDIQVGKIWNNGIVVENKEGTVLLMSLGEWQCYSKELAETLEEQAVDGWLLLNASQARLLNSTFQGESLTALNETLEAEGYDIINVDKRYLYDNGGEVYAFGFKPTSKFLAAGTQTKYRVRLVKTVANIAN